MRISLYELIQESLKGGVNVVIENVKIKNKYGQKLSFELVTQRMDSVIREYLHGELSPCEPQYFYEMYCKMHKRIYDDEFLTEKENIIW